MALSGIAMVIHFMTLTASIDVLKDIRNEFVLSNSLLSFRQFAFSHRRRPLH